MLLFCCQKIKMPLIYFSLISNIGFPLMSLSHRCFTSYRLPDALLRCQSASSCSRLLAAATERLSSMISLLARLTLLATNWALAFFTRSRSTTLFCSSVRLVYFFRNMMSASLAPQWGQNAWSAPEGLAAAGAKLQISCSFIGVILRRARKARKDPAQLRC